MWLPFSNPKIWYPYPKLQMPLLPELPVINRPFSTRRYITTIRLLFILFGLGQSNKKIKNSLIIYYLVAKYPKYLTNGKIVDHTKTGPRCALAFGNWCYFFPPHFYCIFGRIENMVLYIIPNIGVAFATPATLPAHPLGHIDSLWPLFPGSPVVWCIWQHSHGRLMSIWDIFW